MNNGKDFIVIGITGTLGAGKGTVVEFLVKNRGFVHFSVRALLISYINQMNLPVNRDTLTETANQLRKEHGVSFLVEQLYQQAHKQKQHAVIESLRSPGEVDQLKKYGNFWLLAVDADAHIRYKRILKRSSETDHISFEKFLADEAREMHSSDPDKQNLAACIQRADFNITNDGGIPQLEKQILEFLDGLPISRQSLS